MEFPILFLMKAVYFKSFGKRGNTPLEISVRDPVTGVNTTCQTLEEVLDKKTIKTNTRHHVLKDRLSVSCLSAGFPGSYRPEGILFTTNHSPAYCAPFDLMALTDGKTFTAKDFGSDFLPGYEQFVFPDVKSMIQVFPTSQHALKALNQFRSTHGLPAFSQERNYSEVCFEDEIKIEPVALVGKSPEVYGICWKNKIKRYDSVEEHVMAENYPLKYALHQARKLFDRALPYMFDGHRGLASEDEPFTSGLNNLVTKD